MCSTQNDQWLVKIYIFQYQGSINVYKRAKDIKHIMTSTWNVYNFALWWLVWHHCCFYYMPSKDFWILVRALEVWVSQLFPGLWNNVISQTSSWLNCRRKLHCGYSSPQHWTHIWTNIYYRNSLTHDSSTNWSLTEGRADSHVRDFL